MSDNPDENPDPSPIEGEAGDLGGGEDEPQSPYRNLLVPLVVVPAGIVMVLVAIFLLFGAIAGEERTPGENLERMLHGGRNEQQQATFNLVVQTRDVLQARREGRESEWDIDDSFLPRLRDAFELCPEDQVDRRLVLALLLAELGEPDGVTHLIELTRTPLSLDAEGAVRVQAVLSLGLMGPDLEPEQRSRAAEALRGLVDDGDPGVQLAAVGCLQYVPDDETVAALVGLLGDPSIELRGSAALGLAALGDPAGETVLLGLLEREIYEEEAKLHPRKWSDPALVAATRLQAFGALVELGRPPEGQLLSALAEDPDLSVRNAALEVLKAD